MMKKTKDTMMKKTIIGILVLCLANIASASLFYGGNVSVDSIVADVVIGDKADVAVEYTLVNGGDSAESVILGSPESSELWQGSARLPNPILFGARESKTIRLAYSSEIEGEITKLFSFDPKMTINNKSSSKSVEEYLVKILLPKGVEGIVWSNRGYFSSGIENGRASYMWAESDVYPTTLTIKWSTLGVSLSAEKNASPQKITEPGQAITIGIILENKGVKVVDGILLTDDYVPSDFEAGEPREDFILDGSNSSEPHLFWIKRIDRLQPGESRTFNYTVRYVGDVSQIYSFSLRPATVTVGGHLAALSNEVAISKMAGVVPAEEPQSFGESQGPSNGQEITAKPTATWFEITAIVIAVLLLPILVLAVLLIRKGRKSRGSGPES